MRLLQLLVAYRHVNMGLTLHQAVFTIFFYGILIIQIVAIDYCQIEKEKCTSLPHIGCNKSAVTFEVNPNCSNITVVKLKNSEKNYILEVHNVLRDKLASGVVGNYPPASKMLEMYWDEELEATACLHVQYCMFEHDKCRATPSYKYPGQNIRISHYTNFPQTNYKKELYNGILDWFNEYSDVAPDIIEKYENRKNHKQYGHFTVMSKDNNDRIGCCYITYENFFQYTEEIEYSHFFTCNYRETNLINRPIYQKGQPTSQCVDYGEGYESNTNNYTSLCTNKILAEQLTLENEPEILQDEEDLETLYCKLGQTKCGRNKHIGCPSDSGFKLNSACMNIEMHDMSPYQNLLLTQNNKYRDLIASGTYNNFPAATKMRQLEWDVQLEDVACQYVKYCQMSLPAQCLATLNYDLPGQSVYHRYSDKKMTNHAPILEEAVRNWFNQSSAASSNIIDYYENTGSDYYGSFALMIRDAQSKMGCCFITYQENVNDYLWESHFMSCVYEHVNFLHKPLYTKGKAACDEIGEHYATSNIYPNLCTTSNENIADSKIENINTIENIDDTRTLEARVGAVLKQNLTSIEDMTVDFSTIQVNEKVVENVSHYCQLEIEKCNGRRHIGCEIDPGLEINPECIDIEIIDFTDKMKTNTVYFHNKLRNEMAGVMLDGFPTASKMLEVEWDQELADVACEHTKKCSMQSDECRATKNYDNPAQNFYMTYSDKHQPNHTMVLQQGINLWFLEYKQIKTDIIHSYSSPTKANNFLTMIKENNDKIGCCYIQSKQQSLGKLWYSHMFTCNYRENNVIGDSIYTMGKPASECDQWGLECSKSATWNNLCSPL